MDLGVTERLCPQMCFGLILDPVWQVDFHLSFLIFTETDP